MTNGDKIRAIREATEAIMEQIDKAAMEAHVNDAVNYLDWYFHQDEGMADKDAVAAWEKVKAMIPVWRDVNADPPKKPCDCLVVVNGEVEFACCGFDLQGVLHFETPDIFESEEIKGVTHWMPLPKGDVK